HAPDQGECAPQRPRRAREADDAAHQGRAPLRKRAARGRVQPRAPPGDQGAPRQGRPPSTRDPQEDRRAAPRPEGDGPEEAPAQGGGTQKSMSPSLSRFDKAMNARLERMIADSTTIVTISFSVIASAPFCVSASLRLRV